MESGEEVRNREHRGALPSLDRASTVAMDTRSREGFGDEHHDDSAPSQNVRGVYGGDAAVRLVRARARHHAGDAIFPTQAAANPGGKDLTTETATRRRAATIGRTTPLAAEAAASRFAPAAVIVPSEATPPTEDDAAIATTSTTTPPIPLVASVPSTAAATRGTATQITDTPAETSFVAVPTGTTIEQLGAPACAAGTTAADLTTFFDGGDPMIGADYQRAYPLPDGRVLWLFQDAFLPTSHGPQLVHNVGLLQSGPCFQLLRNGSTDTPTSYLFPELTDRYDRWFWPLGGEVGVDGDLHVFVVEMVEHGAKYLTHTEPIATWLVAIELDTLSVIDARPAPDPSQQLYGWSVVSQGDHTYLYAHCYRQFGWDTFPFSKPPFRAHDWECGPDVTVARVPRGDFGARPDYWNGSGWVSDPTLAAPVIPTGGRPVNPTQVALHDGRFVAVTKVGDWWGVTITLDVAAAAEGPWHTYETITVEPECTGCNTYFASVVPYGADQGSFMIGLSGNTWTGDDLDHYTPTFLRVPVPT